MPRGDPRSAPWEALQADSQTTTVAAQERDRSSLLNLYRELIHLRDASSPLAIGALIPLTTSSDAVAAYVRRDGERTVMVIANLGATTLHGVSMSAPGSSLPGGRWMMRDALGGPPAATLVVPADGAISGYVPLPSLAPMTAHVFTLTARRP